jgi:predicted O-methyltransferase YrrM
MKSDAASFADNFIAEDVNQQAARTRGIEVGTYDATPGSGAFLKYLAELISAQAIVEVGTGSGVGTLWLLKGMINSGVLTTIDDEVQHSQIAKEAMLDADIPSSRYRLITNSPLEVMRKLADRAYDLVVLRSNQEIILDQIDEAKRILRTGGVMAIDRFFGGGKVNDPAQRDARSVALRDAGKALKMDDETWSISLNPVGDGVLVATKL